MTPTQAGDVTLEVNRAALKIDNAEALSYAIATVDFGTAPTGLQHSLDNAVLIQGRHLGSDQWLNLLPAPGIKPDTGEVVIPLLPEVRAVGDGILGAYATATLRLIKEKASNADGGELIRMALPEPQQQASTQADLEATIYRAYAGLGVYGWGWRLRRWWRERRAKQSDRTELRQ